MDPSIMKLLEEDEDETMHSGADVEAFTAALNRDIEGDISTSQPSDSDSNALSQGSSHTSSQFLSQWQTSTHDDNANSLSQQDPVGTQKIEPLSAEMDVKRPGLVHENQQQQDNTLQEVNRFSIQHKPSQADSHPPQAEQKIVPISQAVNMQDSENNNVHNQGPDRTQDPDHDAQLVNLQQANSQQASMSAMSNQQAVASTMSNQQPMASGTSNQQGMASGSSSGNQQANNALNRGKQVPFALLLPVIQPQLDKDRAMQLNTLYLKLRKNEISKDGFVRHMRSIVGDQMLKMAVYKLQSQAARNIQNVPSQLPSQSQVSTQQQNLPTSSTVAMITDSSNQASDSNALKPREVERLPESHGVPLSQISTASLAANQDKERSAFPPQGINKQHPQHMHFSHASFPTYGNTGSIHRPYSAMNASTSAPLKQLPHDSQMRPIPAHQAMGATQLGTTTQGMNMVNVPKFDRQNSFNDPKRLQSGSLTSMTNNSSLPQNSVQWQSTKEQKSGAPSSMTYVKQEPLDQSNEQYKSQFSAPQGLSSFSTTNVEQGNTLPGTLKDESFEMQSSRVAFSAPTSTVPSNPVLPSMPSQMDPNNTLNSRMPSATSSSMGIGSSSKAPPKKPSVGQKKPLEALGSSPPPSSKKQKVSGAFLDQSIEQLNDVTAVSGVNLREEEEQLFSGPKEDSRVSEASRRVVQEEEDRLILEKIPLKRKLAEIMAKCGLKGISNDVERCLSLCVEERMRGLIGNLIRLSKQRMDIEKPRHKTVVTSDVRQQIMLINRKAREEWDKKQAEAEKLQRQNEPESNPGVDGEKEKDDGRIRPVKVNKEEDDKMRTTAANVAARAAVGGDDMLSKWQLMAEQARQKREGGVDAASGSQPGKDTGRKLSSARNSRDNQEAEKRGHSAANSTPGAVRKGGRNQVVVPQPKVPRSISVKDVIAVLEREPQMSKSTLLYRLYERVLSDAMAG